MPCRSVLMDAGLKGSDQVRERILPGSNWHRGAVHVVVEHGSQPFCGSEARNGEKAKRGEISPSMRGNAGTGSAFAPPGTRQDANFPGGKRGIPSKEIVTDMLKFSTGGRRQHDPPSWSKNPHWCRGQR